MVSFLPRKFSFAAYASIDVISARRRSRKRKRGSFGLCFLFGDVVTKRRGAIQANRISREARTKYLFHQGASVIYLNAVLSKTRDHDRLNKAENGDQWRKRKDQEMLRPARSEAKKQMKRTNRL